MRVTDPLCLSVGSVIFYVVSEKSQKKLFSETKLPKLKPVNSSALHYDLSISDGLPLCHGYDQSLGVRWTTASQFQ